jgi:hypothetical protein
MGPGKEFAGRTGVIAGKRRSRIWRSVGREAVIVMKQRNGPRDQRVDQQDTQHKGFACVPLFSCKFVHDYRPVAYANVRSSSHDRAQDSTGSQASGQGPRRLSHLSGSGEDLSSDIREGSKAGKDQCCMIPPTAPRLHCPTELFNYERHFVEARRHETLQSGRDIMSPKCLYCSSFQRKLAYKHPLSSTEKRGFRDL